MSLMMKLAVEPPRRVIASRTKFRAEMTRPHFDLLELQVESVVETDHGPRLIAIADLADAVVSS